MHRNSASHTPGFTLLELLIVLGVVVVLCALLAPAILAARRASDLATCGNRLRQLGHAVLQYQSTHSVFPPAHLRFDLLGASSYAPKYYSVHSQLLPYIGHNGLYSAINFDVPQSARMERRENSTAANTRLQMYLCPASDVPMEFPGNSFRANFGTGPRRRSGGGFGLSDDGGFTIAGPLSPADVYDGAAHTSCFSEKAISDGNPDAFTIESDFIHTESFMDCDERNEFVDPHFSQAGAHWLISDFKYTLYDHRFTPDSTVKDCGDTNSSPSFGSFAARSYHSGGVNCLMFDGSLRFVSADVSVVVWRAMGTRCGGEFVNTEQ